MNGERTTSGMATERKDSKTACLNIERASPWHYRNDKRLER